MKTYLIRENCPPNEAELEIKRFFKHVVVFDSLVRYMLRGRLEFGYISQSIFLPDYNCCCSS